MRRAFAAAAALALAACHVDVEGARCDRPGSAEQCPSGQGCGNDGRCSEAAARCAASCQAGTVQCTPDRRAVETCSIDHDPVCGTWEPAGDGDCERDGLVCDPQSTTCVHVQCTEPGAGAPPCPPGQACGNDLSCSGEAARCASRCTPSETRCGGGTSGTDRVEACTPADAICGSWEESMPCADRGLTCAVTAEGPTCVPVPCGAPGATCPPDQACGNDLVCSAAALACAQTRCTPDDERCGAGGTAIERCTADDPVCGRWVAEVPCAASALTCRVVGGSPACVHFPCETPGATTGCPAGQACGYDLLCSAEVAECVATRTFCLAGVDRRCNANARERCDPDAPCGAWNVVEACDALVCDAARDACVCAAPAPGRLYVDAGAGGSSPRVVPNGAESPPECRLASIPAALAIATSGTTVSVVGEAATYPGPFHVAKGVALVAGDEPFTPASRILENSATSGAGVTLEEGARLAGFTVRAAAGDPRPVAIAVTCAATDTVSLEKVDVDAAANASHVVGVELTGACDVDLTDVDVTAATTTGVEVRMGTATAVARIVGGRVEQCSTGIALTTGDLRLDGTAVVRNTGTGVVAGDGLEHTRFTATDSLFASNGDTAIALSGNTRVVLENNRICQNRATTPRGNTSARLVGGIWAHGRPPSGGIVFRGNEIHHNSADQVLVQATPETWSLDGGADATACTGARNLFLGYDPVTGRGIVAANANVSARWNAWQSIQPAAGTDFEAFGAATVDAGVTASRFCDTVYDPRPCE